MSVMDIVPYYNDLEFFALQRNIIVSVHDTSSTGTHNRYGVTLHVNTIPLHPVYGRKLSFSALLNTNAAKVTRF